MTAQEPLTVGVVGASLGKSWGAGTHLPALGRLPAYRILAVGSSRKESARATAEAFDAPLAFSDAEELIAHPDIQVVSICVRVAHHEELVRAAVARGKHVYCEWPLATDLLQAEALAALSARAPEQHMVGLQGVRSRGALHAKELIAQGRIGRVLSASLSVRLSGFGNATLPRTRLHTLTPESGTNLLTVGAGHAMATLTTVLGPLRSLSAATGTRTPTVTVAETGEQVAAEVPDQLTLAGELTDGAVVSAAVLGGAQPGAAHFSLHIVGSEAALDIQPVTPALPVQIAGWAIRLTDHNGSRNLSPDGAEGAVENVAAMYDALATAITTGGRVSPGFGEGLATHRLLAGIERSAQTGSRVEFTDPS